MLSSVSVLICRHSVSVRASVTFMSCAKTNKDIFEIFSPSVSHTILVFPYQRGADILTGTPLTGTLNAGGVDKKRVSRRICGCIGHCVYWCLQHIYRVTLIGEFLGYFRISLHQTRTQYSNEGPQHWNVAQFSKKTLSKCGILSPKNSCHFFRSVNSKFQAAPDINK